MLIGHDSDCFPFLLQELEIEAVLEEGGCLGEVSYAVVSLTSHEPSRADIFLRYYEGDGQAVKEAEHVV